jgi:hypothetical protein
MIGPKVLAARWLLLCALAFGVVGMHHLASMCGPEDGQATVMLAAMPGMTPAAPADDCCGEDMAGGHGLPAGPHDLTHLCLAILVAGLVIGVLLARWRRAGPATGLLGLLTAVRHRSPRPPPGSAAILTSLGVLRL